jgi:hypothetical protein
MPQAATSQQQILEAVVSGPDGANRLFTCTGQASVATSVNPGETKTETWTFSVGPYLPHQHFHRALLPGEPGRYVRRPRVLVFRDHPRRTPSRPSFIPPGGRRAPFASRPKP